MRIPGAILQNGVKSLGRNDINAPMQVANAEANASRAWSNTVNQVGKGFNDIFAGQARAKGNLAVDELKSKHSMANSELQSVMENKPAFRVGDQDNPTQVNAYAAENNLQPGDTMLSSDIMMGVMKSQYRDTRTEV